MKEKIFLLRSDYDSITPTIDDGDITYWDENGYVRISETVEIDFPDLSEETIVTNEISVIDKKITAIMAKSEATITELKARKQELLAITHDGKES